MMEKPVILTKKEAEKIMRKASSGEKGKINVSFDLGVSYVPVDVDSDSFSANDQCIPVAWLSRIKENACYVFKENEFRKIALFSEETNFYYKLLPSQDWPTITLSSTPMHRHVNLSPKKDTALKILAVSPVKGRVLDTCCGLGYTAIAAAKHAAEVHVFERDENVLAIAGYNPYSQDLFLNKKIRLCRGNVFDGIKNFPHNFFDRIIHDPPTLKYSPELYSNEFYLQIFRVLKPGGLLYHYTPCPHKTKKRLFYPKVMKRLADAGFKDVKYIEEASGVRAKK
ncbi:MAG: methyltransferase domain-containing protein [Candidatus Woesearchaeota archaeon]